MALNDDYYDVRDALMRLRKNRPLPALMRLMKRLDELEDENEQLREAFKQQGEVGLFMEFLQWKAAKRQGGE